MPERREEIAVSKAVLARMNGQGVRRAKGSRQEWTCV
jgi:hypothetical protein